MSQTDTSMLRRVRLVLWVLVAVTAVAATALYVFRPVSNPVGAVFGGPFTLESTRGGDFTEASLEGTPSLVFFGYTYCPDVCPTTLAETVAWRGQLGLSADDLNIIFATVDPERDDVAHLKTYVEGFDPSIIGLSGTPEQVETAKTVFGVFSRKVDDPDSTYYLVDHTASVFMIDREGEFFGTIAWGENADTAKAKIQRLTGS